MDVDGLLRLMRPFLLGTAIVAIVIGLIAQHGGFFDLFVISLTCGTLVVAVALTAQIIDRLGAGEMGLDAIALLSMGGALVFGEYLAAALVALMYSGGQYLESIAEGRARREMTALLSRAPHRATRRLGEALQDVAIEDIEVGDCVVVKKGDLVPVDGTVSETTAVLDE